MGDNKDSDRGLQKDCLGYIESVRIAKATPQDPVS